MIRRSFISALSILLVLSIPALATAQDPPAAARGTIEITEPGSWQRGARGIEVHDGETVRVKGFVSHPEGIESVFIDDDRVGTEMMQDGRTRFLAFIPNPEGSHEVTVSGVSRGGEVFGETFTLQGNPRRAAASAEEAFEMASKAFTGERYAVVIGVSDYVDEAVPDLQFAHRDALAFHEFLIGPNAGLGGFAQDHVFRLTNEEATLVNMRRALYRFLQEPDEDDLVYIYFAGHGVADPNRPEDLYLLPHDADINDMPATAFPMRELEYVIDRTRARDVILITDACHSGGINTGGTRDVDVNMINQGFLEALQSTAGGRGTITSSLAGQKSEEGAEWGGGHGVFTYHLLAGLRGNADADNDRIVEYRELFEYVRSSVERDTDGRQVPDEGLGSFDDAWPMAMVASAEELVNFTPRIPENRSSNSTPIMLGLLNSEWFAADSLVNFVGRPDTLEVRLESAQGTVAPNNLLAWRSDNEAVATVDASGVVQGVGPGLTSISATASNKRIDIPVRVFEAPVTVQFNPRQTVLNITQGQQQTISVSVELPGGQIVTGLLPLLEFSDTLVVRREPNGVFSALREGETAITATLAGESQTWAVTVSAPLMSIDQPTGALLVGDTLDLRVRRLAQDGTQLGQALLASWESSNPDIVRPTVNGLVAVAPGRVEVTAVQRASQASLSLFVLGDLIVAAETAGGSSILTVSLATRQRYTILEEEADSWDPSLSPDGTTIAFASKRATGRPRIWLMDADGTNIRRLSADRSGAFGLPNPFYQEHEPVWSHDGTLVQFVSNSSGNYEVYSTELGSGTTRRVVSSGSAERGLSSAPDAPRIAFERVTDSQDSDVFYSLSDGTEVTNFTSEIQRVGTGTRDSKWMEGKPTLLAGGQEMLLVETPPNYREGESLVRYSLVTRQRVGTIVNPRPDAEIVYAASPRGDLVAHNQRPRYSGGDAAIVISQLDGVSVMSIALPQGYMIKSMSWGAVKYRDVGGGS